MERNAARDFMSVPIPTYQEAISRPSSSQRTGPTETSHDAQRQGYRPPTVESARSSFDSDLSVPEMVHDDDDHRELEELDYLEPGQSETTDRRQARQYYRARLRSKFTQQLSNLSATLGALRIPSLRRLYTAVPASSDDNNEPEPAETWRSRLSRSLHIPEQYRMSVPTIARLCALLTIAGLVWFLFTLNFFPRRHMMGTMFEPESVREFVQERVDEGRIRDWLYHLQSFAHEAGSEGNYFMANWMMSQWASLCEFDEQALLEHNIMATYPTIGGRYVKVDSEQLDLEEGISNREREQTLAWHAYSANGKVKGPLIYANHGAREDYQDLHDNNITTEGVIALVHADTHHGPRDAGVRIRFAEEAGCAGILIFNGDILSKGNFADPLMPSNDSIHRANAVSSNFILGDPARKDGLPSIPSLPLSWKTASALLSKLDGRGKKAPNSWLDQDAYTGDTESQAVIVEMQNENDIAEAQPIWHVQARIEGAEAPHMKVVVGAPRDSWCFGASHSASASAVLTEVIAVFGMLRKRGWRPLRTIEFVSWDASTFNLAGSTSYVEDNFELLRESGIAYVNVDAAVGGIDFRAHGSPMLQRVFQRALNRVDSPGMNQSLKETFDADGASVITPLAFPPVLTDSAAFTHIAGVPTLDMGFTGESSSWVKGSCYDDMDWLHEAMYGVENSDTYFKALAQVWLLVVLELATTPLLPLDTRTYALDLATKVDNLEKDLPEYVKAYSEKTPWDLGIDTTPLQDAVKTLSEASAKFHIFEDLWTDRVLAQAGMEDLFQNRQRLGWNGQLLQFEKTLIDIQKHKDDGTPGGLKDRPQFRHVMVAPSKWELGTQQLPTIWDYLDDQEWEKAGQEIARVAAIIEAAAEPLSSVW